MASSFRRVVSRGAATDSSSNLNQATTSPVGGTTTRFKGTKPWTGGVSLTSTGLRELDQLILQGGQAIGTCIWLSLDRWTTDLLGLGLTRYWCAEAISQDQHLCIPVDHQVDEDNDQNDSGPLDATTFQVSSWDEELDNIGNHNNNGNNSGTVTPNHLVSRTEVIELLRSLPRNLNIAVHQQQADPNAAGLGAGQTLGTLAEAEEEEEEAVVATTTSVDQTINDQQIETLVELEDQERAAAAAAAEEGLNIAWQYRKEVQQERLGQAATTATATSEEGQSVRPTTTRNKLSQDGGAAIYCHSYDLQSPHGLSEQVSMDNQEIISVPTIRCCADPHLSTPCLGGSRVCGMNYSRAITRYIQQLTQDYPTRLIRLLFYHPNLVRLKVALPLVLTYIRTHRFPVVILIAARPWTSTLPAVVAVQRACDVVLRMEGFAGRRVYPPPPEFSRFQGLLHVAKASQATAHGSGHFADLTVTRHPLARVFGLRRDRRKLHVELLHIPPEEFAPGGGSVGGSAVRTGAGRTTTPSLACATGGGGGGITASTLDF